MRVKLTIPPALAAEPAVELAIDALALVDDVDGWVARALAGAAIAERLDATTADGWPVTFVHALRADGGHELHGFYRFFELAGHVVARVADRDRYAAHREAIMDLLATARPDLGGGQVAVIAELFE